MSKLRILSVGRNNLKKVEKLDEVAGSLEQLWASYNNIAAVDGVLCLSNLRVLYLGNNKIASWEEVAKLASLSSLEDVLLIGNPIYNDLTIEERRTEVLKNIPTIKKIDGEMVTPAEREAAAASA